MAKAVGYRSRHTNPVVAVLEAGEATVVPNAEGSRTTPWVLAFAEGGEVLDGADHPDRRHQTSAPLRAPSGEAAPDVAL